MKKTITLILLSAALFGFSEKCQAQFLKKLGKSIEKVSKEVDKVLGTEESERSNNTQDNTAEIAITTPHKNLKVDILSAVSNGDEFLLEFTITNTGDDIKGYCLMDGNSDKTIAFDNLGNQCSVTLLFGNVRSKNNGHAENTLLNGVPVKVIATITKFGPNATSFSQVKIGAGTDIWKIANHFVFKNIPIIKEQEVVIPSRETEKPQATEKEELIDSTLSTTTSPEQIEQQDYILSKDQMNGWKAEGLLGKIQSVKYSTGKQIFFNTLGNPSKIINGKDVVTRSYTTSNPVENSNKLKLSYGKNKREIQNYYEIKDGCGYGESYTFNSQGKVIAHWLKQGCSDIYEEKYIYNGTADSFPSMIKGENSWESGNWEVTKTYEYMEFDDNGNWTKRKVNEVAITTDYETDDKSTETKSYVETATYIYY